MNVRAAVPGAEGSGGSRRDLPDDGHAEGDFRALAENLPGVVARLDRRLALLYVNRAAREGHGPAPWPWWPPLREAAARVFETRRAQAWEFGTGSGAEATRYAGRIVPELQGATFDTVLAIAVDTGEAAASGRDRLLAGFPHELRTPLNAITSWTHVLEAHLGDADPTVRRALAGIMIGVEQQVQLIAGLADATRVAGESAIEPPSESRQP
jgi:signal transduction histidine kinase